MSERIRTMIEEERVAARIRELGEAISQEYEGREIHLICVLKGGVFFMCELAKRITVPVTWISCRYPAMGAVPAPAG